MKDYFRQKLILFAALTIVFHAVVLAQKSSSAENERILQEAVRLIEKNDFSSAEENVRKVLAIEPSNLTARTLAGIIAERQEKLVEAEKHFAQAVKIKPNSPETRNNYGAILSRLGQTQEAAKEFEASLKINPNQPNALINLGQIRFAENNFKAAQSLFEKVEKDAEVARALIIIALKLNEKERAKADYGKYSALANSFSAKSRLELGSVFLQAGLLEESKREVEAVISQDSKNVEAIVLLSQIFLQQKDIKTAGKTLESAVAGGIENAKIYAALANVYEVAGYLENAIPAMRLAIEKEPKNEFYRVRYGFLLIDSKAPAAAVIRLQEAAKDFPNSAKILLALGIAQQVEGSSADAQKSFEKALNIEPNSVPAMAYLALIMDEKAQYAETISITERALAVEEKNAILHYLLADTILKIPTGDVAKAEKHLNRTIELDANLTQAYLSLGRLLARQNRWTEAAVNFETAVKLAPDFAEAQYQFGRALARLKRTEESNQAFAKYKILNETQSAKRETTRKELVQKLANTRF